MFTPTQGRASSGTYVTCRVFKGTQARKPQGLPRDHGSRVSGVRDGVHEWSVPVTGSQLSRIGHKFYANGWNYRGQVIGSLFHTLGLLSPPLWSVGVESVAPLPVPW